MNGQVKAELLW